MARQIKVKLPTTEEKDKQIAAGERDVAKCEAELKSIGDRYEDAQAVVKAYEDGSAVRDAQTELDEAIGILDYIRKSPVRDRAPE